MNKALEMLKESGLEVEQVKIAVHCNGCGHSWQLRLLPQELEDTFTPNAKWATCWVCRQKEGAGGWVA